MLQYQIANVRPGGEYSVAGCDVVLGFNNDQGAFVGVLSIKNVWLREKKDGNGYFISWPSAARVKNGTVVKEDGKPKYDNNVTLYGFEGANPKRPGEWAIPTVAWEFQEELVNELLALSKTKAKVNAGRGSAKAGPANSSAGTSAGATPARRARATAPASAPAGGSAMDGDDDLPF
jgi:hypothetical protein